MIHSSPPPATHRFRSGRGLPIRQVCRGCGYETPDDEPIRLRCPAARAGDDVDHVLGRDIDAGRLAFPTDGDPNPFVRYRTLFSAYHRARGAGWSDGEIVALIRRLDARVAAVDGHGFATTPVLEAPQLSERLGMAGSLWIKDETGNVSGSHKARHLFGTFLELVLAGNDSATPSQPLAIASCGNAALAAAVVARAAARSLRVFIPPDAEPAVVDRLRELQADIVVCDRSPGDPGDPTYARLLAALRSGATGFTCQGNLNGLAIEGGMTLGWELVSDLVTRRAQLDHLVIQVGGGALASACTQAIMEAHLLDAVARPPRIHTVQTAGAAPLARAYGRVAAEAGANPTPAAVSTAVAGAARQRSAFMWPWEAEPESIATGILDDETYDWLEVVRGMLLTGGVPLVLDEATLAEANDLARATTAIDADHTGTAGLAGVIELIRRGEIGPNQSVAVIFTGVRRQAPANGGQP